MTNSGVRTKRPTWANLIAWGLLVVAFALLIAGIGALSGGQAVLSLGLGLALLGLVAVAFGGSFYFFEKKD